MHRLPQACLRSGGLRLSVGSTCVYSEEPDTKTRIAMAMATAGMAKPMAQDTCAPRRAGVGRPSAAAPSGQQHRLTTGLD